MEQTSRSRRRVQLTARHALLSDLLATAQDEERGFRRVAEQAREADADGTAQAILQLLILHNLEQQRKLLTALRTLEQELPDGT